MTDDLDFWPTIHFNRPRLDLESTPISNGRIASSSKCNLTANYPDSLFNVQYELSCLLSNPELNVSLSNLIEFVYNPFVYAGNIHLTFLKKYINTPKKLVFLGMNPGPWGMMQTGIPFGEVKVVQDWLGISGSITPPREQHPSKLVLGFNCRRSEVSGKRFWALAKDISTNDPLLFFKNSFVYNYYPLGLLSKTGKNLTPTDLKANERKKLFGPCDAALCRIVELLRVEVIVAIGRFAEKRAKEALKKDFPHVNMAEHMEAALSVAKAALRRGEVPVGCLFIHRGEVIATGGNTVNQTCNATRHAEMDCIEAVVNANPDWEQVLHDTHVVVTVEPCIMCAAALHTVRVASITYGCANDRFGGCSSVLDAAQLYSDPCPVTGGVRSEEAMDLLKEFYKGTNPKAPESKVKVKKQKV